MHGDPLYHCSLVISNLYLEIRSLSFKISRDMINIASGPVPHFLPVISVASVNVDHKIHWGLLNHMIERQKVAKKGQLSMSLVQPTNINQNEAL